MYLHAPPGLIRGMLRHAIWRIKTEKKELYLTFDDGPTPGITELALDILHHYNAKATFFCLGKNADAAPALFQQIRDEQHTVGSHGYEHLNGWRCGLEEYLSNARKGASATGSKLYRPPYGLMSWKQYRQLPKEYRLIMWDVLAGDFDEKLNATQCFKRVKSKARPGSIIVLHDSAKARDRMRETLDKVLRYFTARGYSFKPLAERYS